MLSIIICSKSPELANAVRQNIALTIGVEYELIIKENNVDPKPISVRYNEGASEAKFDDLLFLHEDVKFLKPGWGQVLVDVLKDETIGVVGLTGGKYYPDCPGTWPNDEGLIRENIFYGDKQVLKNPDNETLSDVVTVDGVFMACRKEVWNTYKFDDGLKGFHFYDLDFCFRIITASGLRLVITYAIDMVHFSGGSLTKDWIEQSILFNKKWKKKLPLSVATINKKEERSILKKKLEELVYLYYFKNDGANRAWIAGFYLRHLSILGLSKSLIFTLRYVLLGSSSSFINRLVSGSTKGG